MLLNPQNDCDVKMLILKRWDMDQTKRLFDSGRRRSEFVSFQGYHFIEILSAPETSDLFELYRGAQESRASQKDCDIHTVQSMTLISDGKNDQFWSTPSERLAITFLQLTDSTEWHYDQIKQKIQTIFGKFDQWTLYYSLDFCDLVLFTKNIEFNHFQDVLWKLAFIRDGELKAVCDTFTILSFSAEYLQKGFEAINTSFALQQAKENLEKTKQKFIQKQAPAKGHNNEELDQESVSNRQVHQAEMILENVQKKLNAMLPQPIWEDKVSLSVNLSIKNVAALFDLLEKLKEQNIPFEEYRIPGRYDVSLFLNDISGQQAIMVLYLIDQQTTPSGTSNDIYPIGNYEIVFLASRWGGKKRLKYIPQSRQRFEKTIVTHLNRVLDDCLLSSDDLKDYISETLRATRELISTGFSEEFILSVYPSIVTFLKLLKEIDFFLIREQSTNLIDSRNLLAKNYFTALNTLSLCTMHSERQFIHAPGFNANYFEIPPKLLAFYSSFVHFVATAISTVPRYCYMITPDFRSDIYVQPLHIDYHEDTENHLAIIHLPERYFYDPQSAFMLLSHEVGHYEGNRNRQSRAQAIFDMVSMVLLLDTGLFPCETSATGIADESSLLGVLSHSLGGFLLNKFHLYFDVPNRGIEDHLSDISEFLQDCDYGAQYFQQNNTRQQIVHCWAKGLDLVNYDDAEQVEALKYILTEFDQQERTTFYSQLVDVNSIEVSFEPLAQFLAEKIWRLSILSSIDKREILISQCEMIIQTFSEAYADMQMVRILGDSFSIQHYLDLIIETKRYGNSSYSAFQEVTAEQLIRCNAICNVFNFSLPDDAFRADHLPTNTIIKKVTDYLNKCLATPLDDTCAFLNVNSFLNVSAFDRCQIISNVLHQYTELLIDSAC